MSHKASNGRLIPDEINGVKIPADLDYRGLDSFGRPIWATDWEWWAWLLMLEAMPFGDKMYCAQSGWQILNGGGAAASAHYHDYGDAWDIGVRYLTDDQQKQVVRWGRTYCGPFWRRGRRFGQNMDDHIHGDWCTFENYRYTGLNGQLYEYIHDGDGLVGTIPDYEWRPSPLVTRMNKEALMGQLNDMIRAAIREEVGPALLKAPMTVIGVDTEMSVEQVLRQTHYRAGQARAFSKAALAGAAGKSAADGVGVDSTKANAKD